MNELDRQRAIHLRLSAMQASPSGRDASSLPTGFAALDAALAIGGLPTGCIVELYGPASCGKTALALQAIAHGQSSGTAAAWIDVEHVFDAGFAARLGVDVARLPVTQPATAEEALEMARSLAASGAVELVVIDSAAALVPQLEIDVGLGDSGMGMQSRVLGSELRRLSRVAARSGACILILNQTRARLESTGGVETSAGGPPLKLHAATRIALSATGRKVRFRILKNKRGGPFATGELEWRPGAGFVDRP